MAKNEGKSGETPFVYKIILMIIILGVLFFGVNTFFFKNLDTEIAKLKTTKKDLDEKVSKAQSFKQTEKQNEDEYNAIRAQLTATRAILPLKNEVEDLINKMDDKAKNSNMELLLFKRDEKPISKQFYDEYPISIECNSKFKEMQDFFRFLAEYRQIINVTSIDIKTLTRTSKSKQSLYAKFTAATYVYTGEKSEEIE